MTKVISCSLSALTIIDLPVEFDAVPVVLFFEKKALYTLANDFSVVLGLERNP